jgi:hypothetical protein
MLTPIVIDDVRPRTPGGFPAKGVVGQRLPVSAVLIADGHDQLGARIGGLLELAALDLLRQRPLEPGEHGVGRGLLPRAEHHVDAGLGRHLRHPGPHDPRPDDPHSCDGHGPGRYRPVTRTVQKGG